jgi:FkbM family methyltransferase
MSLPVMTRIGRIPRRILNDWRLLRMLDNWPEAWAAELGRKRLDVFRLRNGVVLHAPPHMDLEFLFHEIWVRQVYTPAGYDIRSGQTVIDVGANIGVFSAFAATRAHDVKVYAFEPFMGNVEWLRRNVEESRLTGVTVYAAAVAGAAGERELHVGSSGITHSLIRGTVGPDSVAVNCITLDDIVLQNNITTCDLLKLDCEGAEFEILYNSSATTLSRIQRITAEYHESAAGTADDLAEHLRVAGYSVDVLLETEPGVGIMCARRTPAHGLPISGVERVK